MTSGAASGPTAEPSTSSTIAASARLIDATPLGGTPDGTAIESEHASVDQNGVIAMEDADGSTESASTAAASVAPAKAMSASSVTTGVQHVYVSVEKVTASTKDDVNRLTTTGVKALVAQLNSYWSAATRGQVRVVYSGVEVRSLNRPSCTGSDVYARAPQVAFGGRFANYDWRGTGDHLLVLTTEHCGGTGMGSVGGIGGLMVSGNGTGMTLGVPVVLHEFGHNLGFGHAGSSICRSTSSVDSSHLADFSTGSATCPTNEYGDYLDIMGYSMSGATPRVSSPELIRAGYLDGRFVDVDASTTQTLTTVISPLGGSGYHQAVRITDPVSGSRYYIEYRTAYGADRTSTEFTAARRCTTTLGYTACARGTSGALGEVRVLRELPYQGSTSYVRTTVLAVGSTQSRTRATKLTTGWTFLSADDGLRVRVNFVHGQSGASITVRFTTPPSTSTTLVSSAKTQPYRGAPEDRAHLTATVVDADGGVPRGNVRFYDGSRLVAQSILHSDGHAGITVPVSLATGWRRLHAVFVPSTGDALQSRSKVVTLGVVR